VVSALGLLESDDRALAWWRGRCSTLLVDEMQDVDRGQLERALLLAGGGRNIFLVGDDDQP
jgi:superfamily I DNA/RNA helicase